MTVPAASGRRGTTLRLAVIGLVAVAVTGAIYTAGRLHTPNYTLSLFGQAGLAAVSLKSLLASVALGLAGLQVLLVQSRRLPGWTLPTAGGALAILVAVLWYSSALWYYNGYQLPVL